MQNIVFKCYFKYNGERCPEMFLADKLPRSGYAPFQYDILFTVFFFFFSYSITHSRSHFPRGKNGATVYSKVVFLRINRPFDCPRANRGY